MSRTTTPCLFVLSLLLGSSAAHSQAASDRLASEVRCRALRAPATLPAVSRLVDSAALVGTLRGYTAGEFVASLGPGPAAALTATPVGPWTDAPDGLLDHLQAAVRSDVDLGAPSVRLRLELAAGRFTVERSELCDPVPLFPVAVAATADTSAPSSAVQPRPRMPVFRFVISAAGIIDDVQLVAGTGLPGLDQVMLNAARQTRYAPALLDGHPVAVTWEQGRATPVLR